MTKGRAGLERCSCLMFTLPDPVLHGTMVHSRLLQRKSPGYELPILLQASYFLALETQ
jgi:hypothetical protein